MPDSLSSTTSPVGIIISPGTSRTTTTKLWAYVWSAEREAEHEAWHHRLPPDAGSSESGWADLTAAPEARASVRLTPP